MKNSEMENKGDWDREVEIVRNYVYFNMEVKLLKIQIFSS